MLENNQGKIFLKAAIPALIAVAKELPIIGTPLRLSMAFHKIWAQHLQSVQDALPEAERPEQLQQTAALRPSEARTLALEFLAGDKQGQVLDQAQREAVADVVAMIPARIQERTHATLMQAKRYGTVAQEVLPLSAKASTSEREEFYSSLLPASRPQFRPGDALPHGNPEWRLVELIGTGGFGEVWRSQHDYLGEERAVKFCQNEVGSAILQREAANLYRLRQSLPNHPHIVRLYDLQLKHQPFWLTFEYVTGGTLESLVRARGAIPWLSALRIIYPVWHAMLQVHDLEIVHRDLKPANILFGDKNVPKIADFGIGKVLAEQVEVVGGASSRRSQGMTTRGYGSAGYMSPEQEEGEAAHPADDTYALAIILWQMLTGNLGRTPRFPKDIQMLNIPEILKKIITACRFLPREQRPSDSQVLPHLKQLLQTETSKPTTQLVTAAPVTEPVPEIVQEPLEPEAMPEPVESTPSVRQAHRPLPSLVRKIQPQDKLDAPIAALQIEPIAQPQPAPVVESLSPAQPTNDAASIEDEVEENIDADQDENEEALTDTSSQPPLTTIAAQTEAHDHYLIHEDGTVTDTRTGLMWKRCAEGQIWNGKTCKKKESRISWNDCMPDGKQKSWPEFAGYTDWRLPTREELRTLVYCSSGQPQTWHTKGGKPCAGEYQKPTIDHIAFPNTPLATFWTASTSSDKSARQVSFKLGCQYGVILSSPARVRLVRSTVLGATTEPVPNDVTVEEPILPAEPIAPMEEPVVVTESLPSLPTEPQTPPLASNMSQDLQNEIHSDNTITDTDTNGRQEQNIVENVLEISAVSYIGKDIEQKLRQDSLIQWLLRNELSCVAANAAIAYYCHNTVSSMESLEKSLAWQQVEMIYKETYKKYIEQKSLPPAEPTAPPEPLFTSTPLQNSVVLDTHLQTSPPSDVPLVEEAVENTDPNPDESEGELTDTSSKPPLTTIVAQTEPHEHYLIHEDGTITDTRTGLMWKRCAEGQIWGDKTCKGGKGTRLTWDDCMPDGKQRYWPAFAGYNDWRLPTQEELSTLVYCRSGQSQTWNHTGSKQCVGGYHIDRLVFPNTPMATWTASPLYTASTSYYKHARLYIRLVRGTALDVTAESVPNDVTAEKPILPAEPIAPTEPVVATELLPPAAVAELSQPSSRELQTPPLVAEMPQYVQHEHYLLHPNGTVTDVSTNLMWKRYAEGQKWDGANCIGEANKMTWDQIMPDDQQKSWPAFAGYNDWRVPTIKELTSLIYCSSGDPKTWNDTGKECKGEYARPTIDQIAFPNAPTTWFWSTTAIKDMYLLVVFGLGLVRRINKYGSYAVRLVRDVKVPRKKTSK